MSAITLASEGGARTAVVERVLLGVDGCARELWVRCQGVVKRVPASAMGVSGAQGERTLDGAVFDAAPQA